jgi:Family of unknown function (DUF6493)
MVDQLEKIFDKEREGELLEFLKQASIEERRSIAPFIKKKLKEYHEFKQTLLNSYDWAGTLKQRNMAQIAAFVCFKKDEYIKSVSASWILEDKVLKRVIDWYCPDWFSEFVNKEAEKEFMSYHLSYGWVMELTKKGYLNPSKELIAKTLPQFIFENNANRTWLYKPEKLLLYPETLSMHIWNLFECESNLHYSDRWLNFESGVQKDRVGWIETFKSYCSEGKIERKRVLQESLLASNRNFNKVLSGWFAELFNQLEASKEEIVELQAEVFSVLSCIHSKPVNTALTHIKKIIQEKGFDNNGFLDHVPVLLSAETKATVASALMIVEKIGKGNPLMRDGICELVTQVFIHSDESLQTRAAKIIENFQPAESFREILESHTPSMLSDARKILSKYLPKDGLQNPDTVELSESILNEGLSTITPIPVCETFDDFIFLSSQAFDNNESWHIDHLPSEILKWFSQINGSNIQKLEPALQRALKMTKGDLRAGQGNLDHMLAIFFIDVCVLLTRRYPENSKSLKKLFETFNQKDGGTTKMWLAIGGNDFYMDGWETYSKDKMYEPYKYWLISILNRIKKGNINAPLLSTPSHTPSYIHPEILIERLGIYEQQNQKPDEIDFQIAVSRCLLTISNLSELISVIQKKLNGEYKSLMLFLIEPDNNKIEIQSFASAWFCASLAKSPKKYFESFEKYGTYKQPFEVYTGQQKWKSFEEEYTIQQYDYKLGKSVTVKDTRKILKIEKALANKDVTSGLKKLITGFLGNIPKETATIYDKISIKATWISNEVNDIKRILLLTPNNPEPLLSEIINRCFQYSTFWSESDKKMIINALQTLHEIWSESLGNTAYLLLATSMIASDKTVINIAGEIWINGVIKNSINHKELGKIIGIHERIEFAPIKRFTDLVTSNLFRISKQHNKSLQLLLEGLIEELPSEPIKNLKKLLELYSELIVMNNSNIHNKVIIEKVKKWQETKAIEKIANKILLSASE